MRTLFIYGNQYDNEIHAWLLFNMSSAYHFKGEWYDWDTFKHCINEICWMITSLKPEQIVFDEHSEYEDAIWDNISSKCDNELEITIDKNGKINNRKLEGE